YSSKPSSRLETSISCALEVAAHASSTTSAMSFFITSPRCSRKPGARLQNSATFSETFCAVTRSQRARAGTAALGALRHGLETERARLGRVSRRRLQKAPDDQEYGKRHDHEVDDRAGKVAVVDRVDDFLSVRTDDARQDDLRGPPVAARHPHADDRHQQVADDRCDDASEGRAGDDADGQRQRVLLEEEFPEFSVHGARDYTGAVSMEGVGSMRPWAGWEWTHRSYPTHPTGLSALLWSLLLVSDGGRGDRVHRLRLFIRRQLAQHLAANRKNEREAVVALHPADRDADQVAAL